MAQKSNSTFLIVGGVIIVVLLVANMADRTATRIEHDIDRQAAKTMREIRDQVAQDARAEYRIAKRNGNAMDACVHAGFVAAAYLQAQDESNYKTWKSIESTDCRAAGLPTQ